MFGTSTVSVHGAKTVQLETGEVLHLLIVIYLAQNLYYFNFILKIRL